MDKIKVGILGCTGIVGQVFMWLLARHEWFDIGFIAASSSRKNKRYGEDVRWLLPVEMPDSIADMIIEDIDYQELKKRGIKIIFSALPAEVALQVEKDLRHHGFYVFSNASSYRYEEDVPILIPEANADSIRLIEKQGFPHQGFIVTNANCSVTGLAVALAPLRKLNIKRVFASTYQSISGAGYPGLSALDVLGNVIPFINNEEKKMIVEFAKILSIDAELYPHCVRVPTLFGHLETVWIEFKQEVSEKDVLQCWQNLSPADWHIPLFPEKPVIYVNKEDWPQTKMGFWGSPPGMPVYVGRLRQQNKLIGFSLLVNNLVKGAAGGSIQNAGIFVKEYGRPA